MNIDRLLQARAAEGRPVRVGLYGAGFMARGIVNQIAHSVPGMRVSVICNRSVDKALEAYRQAGQHARVVDGASELKRQIAAGIPAVTDDPALLYECDVLDCLIDATGAIDYGARISLGAIAHGRHMVTMNAELDGTVGPLLKRKADAAGVIFSACDGDQPGVQMNLYRFVRSIGLTPLLCGNIKGLQDPYRTPATQAGFAAKWGQDPHMVTSFADGTKISFEQAIVANGTGMSILQRGMTGYEHRAHVDELTRRYDIETLRAVGGAVDYVVGALPSPGVFVLASHDDARQQHYLNLYKLGEGPLYSFYTPYHLCHFEVPLSVARVVLLGDAVLQPLGAPLVEVIATAKRDLAIGETIDGLGGYMSYGQCERADISANAGLLPMGVAEGCVLRHAVAKDQVLTYDDVQLPANRLIDRLRAEQASVFADAAELAA
ncbi:NAD(P)H-dependent oxidoreductase [Xanthomonas arboricola]|uniref:NAD(P)H-dependent oxidoreductase n=1 Tax=Xanthomonas arboricola TaxID=56448 RepID=UPI00063EACC0|nr:SAF domain-containing protein [Xanthomonas arboricola]MBB3849814.1 putative homoserine dehydrogenase-like protein [Xanthomonas arboricola]PPT17533.1 NAD(P)-dependent oxidoreductase [Xanthomonas arboricola]PPT50246.1 NAD(P)-dependent oxidoreductase [Xanthomonas arboricola]